MIITLICYTFASVQAMRREIGLFVPSVKILGKMFAIDCPLNLKNCKRLTTFPHIYSDQVVVFCESLRQTDRDRTYFSVSKINKWNNANIQIKPVILPIHFLYWCVLGCFFNSMNYPINLIAQIKSNPITTKLTHKSFNSRIFTHIRDLNLSIIKVHIHLVWKYYKRLVVVGNSDIKVASQWLWLLVYMKAPR